ncbi:FHA domain-containing protein, partial [bacterium]|nr:FHA domain-containing protein [bacterium]
MWIIRFLSGPQAGQIVPLNKNNLLLGRSAKCDIKVNSNGVSKEHLKIDVLGEDLLITDKGSRNGTFLNGVQIRSAKVKSGDHILVHNLTLEVQNVPAQWAQQYQMMQSMPAAMGGPVPQFGPPQSAAAHDQMEGAFASPNDGEEQSEEIPKGYQQFFQRAQKMLDREVLPGIYKLPESLEFKWVLACFMAIFIVLVTSLSTIPLIRILKVSLEEESQQHALTIATTLAKINRPALLQGMESAVSVNMALNRPGVKDAMILSNLDGQVIAPANKAGTFPDEPYIHRGRKLNKESVHQYDDSTVIAMVPIEFYNSQTGT